MKDCNEKTECLGRRNFLVKVTATAGGMLLTLSGLGGAFAKSASRFGDVITVSIDDKSPLHKVGGWQVIESKVGKIIILRTGEASFVAFSAKCTHRGATIKFDEEAQNFRCPRHGSRFDKATGAVVKGPAKTAVAAYPTNGSAASVTVSLKASE